MEVLTKVFRHLPTSRDKNADATYETNNLKSNSRVGFPLDSTPGCTNVKEPDKAALKSEAASGIKGSLRPFSGGGEVLPAQGFPERPSTIWISCLGHLREI